jgi:hypothetical protein
MIRWSGNGVQTRPLPRRCGRSAGPGTSRWLELDDERLAAKWAEVTSNPAWAELPQSAQDLYSTLHAKAAERGSLGGASVLLGHRQAIALIEAMTGRRYNSLATITKARLALIKADLVTVEVGQAWQPGFRNKATVYNLLPGASEQCLYPHKGIVHLETGEARPVLTDRQREILLASFREGLDKARQMMEAEARMAAIFPMQETPAAGAAAQDDDWMILSPASSARRVLILPSPPVLTGERLSGVDDAIAAAEEGNRDGERAGHAA